MEDEIEVEKSYSTKAMAAKLRRLAEALENETAFEIQVAGKRIRVPASANIEIEYEQNGDECELEIEIKWNKS